MVAFYNWGPRTEVEVGQVECAYGKWFGRAWQDVSALMVGSFGGVALLLYVGTLSTGVLDVSDFPIWAKALLLGAALTVGVGLGALVCFLWGLRPTAWKRHWVLRIERYQRLEGGMGAHSGLSIHSKHHHRVINLRCVVRDPSGAEWRHEWWDVPHHIFKPGESRGWSYPREFGNPQQISAGDNANFAPWPEPGRYVVRWESDLLDGAKPRVVAKRKWNVEA